MQSAKGNSKKPVAQVKKPILKGSWHGKDAWKLALKRMLSMLAVTVIYLIAGMLLSFESLGAPAVVHRCCRTGDLLSVLSGNGARRKRRRLCGNHVYPPGGRTFRRKGRPCALLSSVQGHVCRSGGRGSVCGVCRRLRGAYASDHLYAGRAPVLDGGAHAPERIRRRAALL